MNKEVYEWADHLEEFWNNEDLVFVAHRISLLYQEGDYHLVSNVMREFKDRVRQGYLI